MMVPSWCWCRRAVVVTTIAMVVTAATPAGGEGGGGGGGGGGGAAAVIQQVERSLLSMFGMQTRPRVKKGVSVPPYMMELYRRHSGLTAALRQQEGEGSSSTPSPKPSESLNIDNTIRSFIHKESVRDSLYPGNRMRLHFNVSNIDADELLHTAELRLTHTKHVQSPINNVNHLQKTANQNRPHRRKRWTKEDIPYVHRIMVYDILRRATKKTEPVLKLLDTKVIDARREGTQVLDVFDALGRWMQKPEENYGILVDVVPIKDTNSTVDTSHIHLRKSDTDETWHERQPLLVTHSLDSKGRSRSKRSAATKHKKTKNFCKRYPLYVDFRKVGWDDWIMAPPGYDAYFCKGDCPFPLSEEMNATNHAVVQTLVNSRYPDRVPKACCVPTELSAISMLYMDDDEKFVLKNHQDMVVEGCGCR